MGMFYPRVCQVCLNEPAGAEEGFVCFFCRNQPGAVSPVQPPYCDLCGLPHEGEISEEYVCSNCADMALHFSWARASVIATPFLLDLIHRYKYKNQRWFEPFFVRLFLDGLYRHDQGHGWDALVPLPLHRVRLRQRQFNQAEVLARALAHDTGANLLSDAVYRRHPTVTQTTLSRPERLKNVERAFICPDPDRVRGRRLLLIDDILTTGATTSSCARVLKKAGAESVQVFTLARGR